MTRCYRPAELGRRRFGAVRLHYWERAHRAPCCRSSAARDFRAIGWWRHRHDHLPRKAERAELDRSGRESLQQFIKKVIGRFSGGSVSLKVLGAYFWNDAIAAVAPRQRLDRLNIPSSSTAHNGAGIKQDCQYSARRSRYAACRPGCSRKASANVAREGYFNYFLVESPGIFEPLLAAAPRPGRRTVLTFPLPPPPQKK